MQLLGRMIGSGLAHGARQIGAVLALALGFGLVLGLGLPPCPAQAQQGDDMPRFAPIKSVNAQVITEYELAQRMLFLQILGFTGDLRAEAMSGLIDDRLRMGIAREMGLTLSPEALRAGMEEFAARGTLNADEFIAAIAQQGVAIETFRDFVSAGLVWRDVVRQRFSGSVVIEEAAIDRALTQLTVSEAQTVTLAEIVLDASDPVKNSALALARNLEIDFIKGRDFADAARAVSVGPTARNGGRLPPQRLSQLDQNVAVLVRGLNVGQVSKPLLLDGRLYLFQMLENTSQPVAQSGAKVVDYALITLPSATAAASLAALRRAVDGCDDLDAYATPARGLSVVRQTQVSGDLAGALQLLDAGEMAGPITRPQGGAPVAVMLCARGLEPSATATRDEVRIILTNQRLAAMAEVYLSELRATALIRDL